MIRPIAIIGGGITGLQTAVYFDRNQIPYQLFEKSDFFGGRVKTFEKQGFRMDKGFQVLQTNYPALQGEVDFKALDMHYFPSAAKCLLNGKFIEFPNPFKNPFLFFRNLFSGLFSFQDILAFLRLEYSLLGFEFDSSKIGSQPTKDYLLKLGFSNRLMEAFFVPFFGGVFFDKSLAQPKELFLFYMQQFLDGKIGIPAKGMQELPNQLAQSLRKESLRLNAKVEIIDKNRIMVNGEIQEVAGIIVATDLNSTAQLLGEKGFKGDFGICRNLYYQINKGHFDSGILHLMNQKILHFTILSQVSSAYSEKGYDLLSITVLEEGFSQKEIEEEFKGYFPEVELLSCLGEYYLPEALPRMDAYLGLKNKAKEMGIVLAGDYLYYPSLNACFESAKNAFERSSKFINFTA